MPKADPQGFRIGIAGLAQAASQLLAGRLYALAAPDRALALSCAAGTIALALQDKLPAVVITDAAAEPLLQALEGHGVDARAQVRAGRLRLFRWRKLEYGLRLPDMDIQFVDELEHFRIPDGALLIVDPADSLLAQGDTVWLMTQIRTYRGWLRSSRVAMLYLLREPVGALSKLGESGVPGLGFSGFAQLLRKGRGAIWETMFWRFGEATVVSPPQELSFDPRGCLHVEEDRRRSNESQRGMSGVADHGQVYCTAQTVAGERDFPSHWHVVDGLDSMLALEPAPLAATCVLHAGGMQSFPKLAQTVHSLRRRCGKMLRIVVSERSVRLRSVQERLLLSIGANIVVFGAADIQRIENITQALRGQWYQREIPEDFERAMADALPPPQMGYLPPVEFADGVLDGLARARNLSLESTLLRLIPAPGVSPVELVHSCQLSRAGDLISMDEHGIHLFLYACSARDVAPVLKRVFPQALEQLFSDRVQYESAAAINQAVSGLRQQGAATSAGDGKAQVPPEEITAPMAPQPESPQPRGMKPAPLPMRSAGAAVRR